MTVTAPIDGGLFSFGDKIQYKVTVTDPEDSSINCNDVRSTFVLGHDTHGHAEQRHDRAAPGFLQTDADRRRPRRQRVRRHLARPTPTRARRAGVPPLTTTTQIQIRQKHQEVEHVVNQSGTTTATNTDGGGGRAPQQPRRGDWLQLNGPFNLLQIDTVAFRYADAAARPHRRLAAGGDRHPSGLDHRSGHRDGEPDLDGRHRHVGDATTFPLADVAAGKHELFVTFRTVTGGATGANLFNLNWAEFIGNGVTVQETSTPGSAGGTVPATLSLSLGTPASFGPFTPGVAQDVHRVDDGQRHLDRG